MDKLYKREAEAALGHATARGNNLRDLRHSPEEQRNEKSFPALPFDLVIYMKMISWQQQQPTSEQHTTLPESVQ